MPERIAVCLEASMATWRSLSILFATIAIEGDHQALAHPAATDLQRVRALEANFAILTNFGPIL